MDSSRTENGQTMMTKGLWSDAIGWGKWHQIAGCGWGMTDSMPDGIYWDRKMAVGGDAKMQLILESSRTRQV